VSSEDVTSKDGEHISLMALEVLFLAVASLEKLLLDGEAAFGVGIFVGVALGEGILVLIFLGSEEEVDSCSAWTGVFPPTEDPEDLSFPALARSLRLSLVLRVLPPVESRWPKDRRKNRFACVLLGVPFIILCCSTVE